MVKIKVKIEIDDTTKVILKVSLIFWGHDDQFQIDDTKVIGKTYTNDTNLKVLINSAKVVVPNTTIKEVLM